jgi:cysteine/O-acetylserine efflux protein
MPNFTAFLSYILITSFTPGPNNIMSMTNASRYSFRKSFTFNIGIFFGFFIIIGLSSVFSITLISLIPSIKSAMTWIGAAYILWLAWKTYHSKSEKDQLSNKNTNTFLSGLLLQFVNPKVILYSLTTVSTFIIPYYSSAPILAGFALLLALVGFASTCCWALFGSVFHACLAKHNKLANIIMAILLVYCAVSLFR